MQKVEDQLAVLNTGVRATAIAPTNEEEGSTMPSVRKPERYPAVRFPVSNVFCNLETLPASGLADVVAPKFAVSVSEIA